MSIFQAVNGENMEALAPYFAFSPNRICDNTAGVTFQWRRVFETCAAVVEGCLIARSRFINRGFCYSVPLGPGNGEGAWAAAEADAQARQMPLRFACVGEEQLPLLRARYGAAMEAEPVRDWADYLYEAETFEYAGKKHHSQKNHINHFYKQFPEARCVAVTEEMLPQCRLLLDQVAREQAPLSRLEEQELQGTMDLLELCGRLRQRAACLLTRQGMVALSVGEVRQDTLYVHGEKAIRAVQGAYPAMAQAFVAFAGEGVAYVNREDDGGEEGLRFSKMNYKPLKLIPKYLVTVSRL